MKISNLSQPELSLRQAMRRKMWVLFIKTYIGPALAFITFWVVLWILQTAPR